MLTLTVRRKSDPRVAVRVISQAIQDKILLVLEATGADMLTWLQSLTEEERGWASITGELAGAYGYEVTPIRGGARLTLRNDAQRNGFYYAVILERRDGLFVLSSVTDPGGPVEEKMAAVVGRIAPEMRVVRG